MYRSFLSWRYLVSRGINLIGVCGIFLAVGALILILSIMTGFLDESRRSIRGNLSDLVLTPQHLTRLDFRQVPLDPDRILAVVRSDERVEAASAHLVWYGMLVEDYTIAVERLKHSRFGHQNIVQLVGVDLSDELGATELRRSLEWLPGQLKQPPSYAGPVADPSDPFAPPPSDEYVQSGLPKSSIILGRQMMESLGVHRGDVVTLATAVPNSRTQELQFNNKDFVVAGGFWTGENEMDLERLYLERDDLRDLLNDVRSFSEVLVKVRDYDREADGLVHDLTYGLSDLGLTNGRLVDGESPEIKTWEDFRGPLLGAIENERALMGIMLSLVLIVAGFTVFAILSMMVTEKTRDIGILTAIGATPRGVMALFLLIGFWDALVGAIAGAIVGCWAAVKIDPIERWLSETFGIEIFRRDVYIFDHIPSRVEPVAVATIVLSAFVCTLLFAALPAWRAASVDPIRALRYE